MRHLQCDVMVVGGGLGGVAAALSVAENGFSVAICEETRWVGGQLTSQAVPPDEHRWIESFGCTARYRALRNRLRALYSSDPTCTGKGDFNPGGGWVSAITARPNLWHRAMVELLAPHLASGHLTLFTDTVVSGGSQLSDFRPETSLQSPLVRRDRVRRLTLTNLATGSHTEVRAKYFLDATELGDLLSLTGTEYVTGSEAGSEPHGSARADAGNQQGLTWVFAMSHDEGSHRLIDKPNAYEKWRSYRPDFWPNPLFSLQDLDPLTNMARTPPLPLFSDDWRCWFKYRQIHDPNLFSPPHGFPTTIVNWPQNDYFLGEVIEVAPEVRWRRLSEAKEQSRCLLYWLQTECPRPDGGLGYPGLFASNEYMGSPGGFALTPYIRESRRIVAAETILEGAVSQEDNLGLLQPPFIGNSVGLGSYRIDLHPSTGGDAYIDLATLPFQIPLGALIPTRTKNLLPACKNIGSTHITNGCFRLHPVEWNVGEVSGLLACFCIKRRLTSQQVYETPALTQQFQAMLHRQGVETRWPENL